MRACLIGDHDCIFPSVIRFKFLLIAKPHALEHCRFFLIQILRGNQQPQHITEDPINIREQIHLVHALHRLIDQVPGQLDIFNPKIPESIIAYQLMSLCDHQIRKKLKPWKDDLNFAGTSLGQ